MKSLIRFVIFTACLLTAGSAFATTYYIDYSAGADTNSGTAKTTPWKHAPGMTGCSNNCASASPASGDSVIFKGGVTWHNDVFSWDWTWTGTSGGPIYVGVDKTWYTGGSWTRPIMNDDNPTSTSAVAGCAHQSTHNNVLLTIDSNVSYVTFDNFEWTGLCWSDATSVGTDAYINWRWGFDTISNGYFHGWTHTAGAGSQGTGIVGGTQSNGGDLDAIVGNVVDGSDSDSTSFAFVYGDCYDAHQNVVRYVSNGMVCNNMQYFHDNLIEYVFEPYDSAHGNGFEFNSEWRDTTYAPAHYVYNNVLRHIHSGVTAWSCPNSTMPDYYYNNVIFDSSAEDWSLSEAGNGCATPSNAQIYFYNNTFQRSSGSNIGGGTTNAHHYLTNNNCITDSGSCLNAGTLTETTDITQTNSAASSQGYTSASGYAPTSSSGATVGSGSNLSSSCSTAGAALCSTTTLGNTLSAISRSVGKWDIGAFQMGGGAVSSGPQPPTNLTATVN